MFRGLTVVARTALSFIAESSFSWRRPNEVDGAITTASVRQTSCHRGPLHSRNIAFARIAFWFSNGVGLRGFSSDAFARRLAAAASLLARRLGRSGGGDGQTDWQEGRSDCPRKHRSPSRLGFSTTGGGGDRATNSEQEGAADISSGSRGVGSLRHLENFPVAASLLGEAFVKCGHRENREKAGRAM